MFSFGKLTRALLRLERTMNLLEGRREGGEGTWGRDGGWGGRYQGGEGGMTVIHILIGRPMFNSNPMIPQYFNNNLTSYYVIT